MRRINTDDFFNLDFDLLRISLRQIHFVENGKYFKALLNGFVAVCDRLRFNPLTGIYNQQRAFTGRQGA